MGNIIRGVRRVVEADEKQEAIRFGSYNIYNIRNGRMQSALRRMAHSNIDLGVYQETNITRGIYVQHLAGYRLMAVHTPIRHRRGMEILYWESPRFAVESHQHHVQNVVIFQLVLGGRGWFVMGYYLTPDDTSSIECVFLDIVQCPLGTVLLVSGSFNAGIAEPEGHGLDKVISETVEMVVLEYMSGQLLPHQIPWARDSRKLSMLRKDQEVKSWADCILGTYRHLFQNLSSRYPRHNTDKYMILGCLSGTTLRDNQQYLIWCMWIPLCPPKTSILEDTILMDLKRSVPKPSVSQKQRASFIYEETWQFFDARLSF